MDVVVRQANGYKKAQLEETSRLTSNDNTTAPKRCDCSLWETATHPVINSSMLFVLLFGVGFCGTALVLPGKLECLDDDCDPSGLGSALLHYILIGLGLALYAVGGAIGIWGAKQRSDKLEEVTGERSTALSKLIEAHEESKDSFEFSKGKGSTIQDDDVDAQEHLFVGNTSINSLAADEPSENGRCWPINPLAMTFISNVAAVPLSLGAGTIVQLLCAPTQLGGSGYLLSGLKAGSEEMWGGLAGLLAGAGIDGVLIYLNHRSTNHAISTTKQYEEDVDEFKLLTHTIENPVMDPDFFKDEPR
jgi:hypothetical protein